MNSQRLNFDYCKSAQAATLPELTYQNFLFGGKELDREFQINTYDFEARSFDQTSGRFTKMVPMAEKYYSISPYAYCANNPLNFIDPSGKYLILANVTHDNNRGNPVVQKGLSETTAMKDYLKTEITTTCITI